MSPQGTPPRRLAVLLGLAGLALLTGCAGDVRASGDESGSAAGAEAATASRLTTIRETGRLKVCTTGDFPPFSVEDESGELAGIDVDMARDLALTLGVEVEWVKTRWSSLMEDFRAKCDLAVGGIDRTPERAEQAFFTAHTMVDGKTPLVRCEDVEEYRTVQDINRPGVISIFPEGSTLEDYARDTFPRGELRSHDGPGSIFDEVIEGRADVITMDRSEVLYVDHDNEELCAANPDDPFTYAQKGYLLPQGDVVLKYYVDQWLSIARNDGTYEMISRPWFGDGDLMPGR